MVHRIAKGDAFYDEQRKEQDLQPNGEVIKVDRDEDGDIVGITVRFHHDPIPMYYFEEEFDSKWTDSYGGCWFLPKG